MEPFQIGQGDTLPIIKTPVLSGGKVVDLTEATAVRFHMSTIDDEGTTADVVDADGTFTDDGEVAYVWAAGDTDTAGVFAAEFEVTFPDGVLTAPNTVEKQLVIIAPQLG